MSISTRYTCFALALGAVALAAPASGQVLAALPFDPTGQNPVPVQVPNQMPLVVTISKVTASGAPMSLSTAQVFLPATMLRYTIPAGMSRCKITFLSYGNHPMAFLARSNAGIARIMVTFGGGAMTPICVAH